jgi:acetylornithine deacetylase/succinyl-diaminopimelate desuccinylase-like protein
VTLTVDARAPDAERLERLLEALELEPTYRTAPVEMAPELRAILREELEAHDLPVVELPSGAGHDAAVLAAAGVTSGMLFVRGLNGGISHSPEEHSSPEDIAFAIEVLTSALRRVAS